MIFSGGRRGVCFPVQMCHNGSKFENLDKLFKCCTVLPGLTVPRLSGRWFGDFRNKFSFFFLARRANLVFNMYPLGFWERYIKAKIEDINILMCKTLRAWQKKGRKLVPRRSKRPMRDFKVPRIH